MNGLNFGREWVKPWPRMGKTLAENGLNVWPSIG